MIELNTGVPGSGKTLGMVSRLAKLFDRWASHPEEARPVFVLGVPDLALPHSPVPLKSVQSAKGGAVQLVPDWDLMPDGSLVLIDEAQGCFPPRSSQSTPPEHVAFLNIHRHRGFDLWITTQHPKLIDGAVRALVGKHQHYRRLFGGSRAVVYEWDCCSDSLNGMKTAVKSFWPYPKKAFSWYKSAEIHTKQSFKLPWWVVVPFFALALMGYFMPRAYAVFSNGITGKGVKIDEKKVGQFSYDSAASGVVAVGALAPTSNGAGSAIGVGKLPEKPMDLTQISACISSDSRCQCYTHHGIKLKMSDEECRAAAETPNEKFRLAENSYSPSSSSKTLSFR